MTLTASRWTARTCRPRVRPLNRRFAASPRHFPGLIMPEAALAWLDCSAPQRMRVFMFPLAFGNRDSSAIRKRALLTMHLAANPATRNLHQCGEQRRIRDCHQRLERLVSYCQTILQERSSIFERDIAQCII